MTPPSWSRYLEHYHRAHPGVTETAFEHARDGVLGSPYDWLAAALPAPLGDVLDVACGNAAFGTPPPARQPASGLSDGAG